jgi:hypothetical protein
MFVGPSGPSASEAGECVKFGLPDPIPAGAERKVSEHAGFRRVELPNAAAVAQRPRNKSFADGENQPPRRLVRRRGVTRSTNLIRAAVRKRCTPPWHE